MLPGLVPGRSMKTNNEGIGADLKKNLQAKDLGPWYVGSHMMGETIPKETNYLRLDSNQKDEWGMPLLDISIAYDDNDEKMTADFMEQLTEMYTKAGFTNIKTSDFKASAWLGYSRNGRSKNGK